MQTKDRIDGYGLACMSIIMIVSSSIIFVPATVTQGAGRDAWITVLIAGIVLLIYTCLLVILYFNPSYSPFRFPYRWANGIVGIVFASYCGYIHLLVVKETVLIFKLLMQETPYTAFLIGLLVVSFVFSYYGRETIARTAQIAFPLLFIGSLINLLAVVPGNVDFTLILPVMEAGLLPILGPIPYVVAWGGELLVFTLFADVFVDRKRTGQLLIASTVTFVFLLTIFLLAALTMLGPPEVARSIEPTFTIARLLSITAFLARIEILLVNGWLLGTLIKLGILSYCAGLALQRGFDLPGRWHIGLSAAVILVTGIMSSFVFPGIVDVVKHGTHYWPYVGNGMMLFVFLLGLLPARSQAAKTAWAADGR